MQRIITYQYEATELKNIKHYVLKWSHEVEVAWGRSKMVVCKRCWGLQLLSEFEPPNALGSSRKYVSLKPNLRENQW